jgi:16S rRNA C967 or C1407 C5-methylase (RsmB/RsmF family)/NOL1/NOP2/fmu family ribosome biogenesis protein
MFPEEFKIRLCCQTYIDTAVLLNALEETSPVSIRINTNKWKKIPIASDSVSWCENGFYLNGRPSYTLDPLFHSGCYYPQEASSMFIEQVFKQIIGEKRSLKVLDLCAAPGGKSTHLSDLIGDESMLISNEVIRSRAQILSETVTKWGNANTLVTNSDPSAFGKLKGFFDLILVDAPCSGEGMFRNPSVIEEWSVENANLCSERQKRILADVWSALSDNGILIYSTCTFNPAENEENVKWLTENNEAESLKLDISNFNDVTEINHKGSFGYAFHPGKIKGEGFFISVIRKNDGITVKKALRTKVNPLKPSKADYETAEKWSCFETGRLIKNLNTVLALHCPVDDYAYLFQNIKILKPGTELFTVKKNSFIPSHDLAMSKLFKNDSFQKDELSHEEAISFLCRNNLLPLNKKKGWSIVTFGGVNLGFINNLVSRINNYYPVGWRIRMNIPENSREKTIRWEM